MEKTEGHREALTVGLVLLSEGTDLPPSHADD